MQHIDDDDDGLDHETTLVTVRKCNFVAYRRLVITANSKPRGESTSIYIAGVVLMTAALLTHTPF